MNSPPNEKIIDIECENCSTSFDNNEQEPKFLYKCSHYICLKCINNIFMVEEIFTCPFCKQSYTEKESHDFPTSSFILNTMYTTSKKRKLNYEQSNENTQINILQDSKKQKVEENIQQESPKINLSSQEKVQSQPEKDQYSTTSIENNSFRIKEESYNLNNYETSINIIDNHQTNIQTNQEEQQKVSTNTEQPINKDMPLQEQKLGAILDNQISRIKQDYTQLNSNSSRSRSPMSNNNSKNNFLKKDNFANGKRKHFLISENSSNNNSKTNPFSINNIYELNKQSQNKNFLNLQQSDKDSNIQNTQAQQNNSKQGTNSLLLKNDIISESIISSLPKNDLKIFNEKLNNFQEKQILDKEGANQSLTCQNSRGFHSQEQQKNVFRTQNNLQKQYNYQSSKFKSEKLPYPKKQIDQTELQKQLQPQIQDAKTNQSNSAFDTKSMENTQFMPMCSTHNQIQKYFCEIHQDSYCIKCYQHSFCDRVTLVESITISKHKQLIQIIYDEKNMIDQLQNLICHFQNINNKIYNFQSSKIVDIERVFSEFINILIQKKENIIYELTSQCQTFHEQIQEKIDCIKSTIDKTKYIFDETNQIKQSLRQFSNLSSQTNINTKNQKQSSSISIKDLFKRIEDQQQQLLSTAQQFQDEMNKLNNKQSNDSNEQTLIDPQSTLTDPQPILIYQDSIQTINENTNTNQNKQIENPKQDQNNNNNSQVINENSNQIINNEEQQKLDINKYINVLINDKDQTIDSYLNKLTLMNMKPNDILQQCYSSCSHILSI